MTALTQNFETLHRSLDGPGSAGPSASSKARGWVALLAAALAILVFMFIIGPKGLENPTMESMVQTIEDHGIKANAYYYTEVDQFFDAQAYMLDNRAFTPAMK